MVYDPGRVTERLQEIWNRKDLGGSAAWLDLPCPDCERAVCRCGAGAGAPERRPVALDGCIARLEMRALADRLDGTLPSFLRTAGSPRPRRGPRRRPMPVGVLAAIHTVRESAR